MDGPGRIATRVLIALVVAGSGLGAERAWACGGAVVCVDVNSASGTENGSAAHPYKTIQAAIDAASPGNTLRVKEGVYSENVEVTKSLTFRGGYPSGGDFSTRSPSDPPSVIAGAADPVVLLTSGVATFDNFVIQGASTSSGSSDAPPPPDFVPDLGGSSAGSPCGGTVRCVGPGAAFATIQAAVDAASSGDTIQVKAGTYDESVSIIAKELTVLGGFPAGGSFATRNPAANPTTISSSGPNAAVALRSVTVGIFDGFVIRGGEGFKDEFNLGDGAGFYVASEGNPSSPGDKIVLSNNVIEENGIAEFDRFGGGIYCQETPLDVVGNIIRQNRSGFGAGMLSFGCKGTVEGNLFEENFAAGDHGGGVHVSGNPLSVVGNVIRGNTIGLFPSSIGYGWGGGLHIQGDGTVGTTRHNRVTENQAITHGSGVFIDEEAEVDMFGDLVYANVCATDGSGISINSSDTGSTTVTLTNVTVADHPCGSGHGHGIFNEEHSAGVFNSVTVRNGIAWNNGTDPLFADQSAVTATYTLVQGGHPGTGNFSQDPLFANPVAEDYHLRSQGGRFNPATGAFVNDAQTSPAIDAAQPSDPVLDETSPNGGRRNLGAYGGTSEASRSP